MSRERIRQLCAKYLHYLISQITYYTKDVIEFKADKDAQVEVVAVANVTKSIVEGHGQKKN